MFKPIPGRMIGGRRRPSRRRRPTLGAIAPEPLGARIVPAVVAMFSPSAGFLELSSAMLGTTRSSSAATRPARS